MNIFPAGKSKLNFYLAAFYVHAQRHEGVPLFGEFAGEPFYLLLMEEELPLPQGIVVEPVTHLVERDVHPHEKDLTVFYPGIGFLDIHMLHPDRFDLGSLKCNTGLKCIEDLVLEPRFLVPYYFNYFIGHLFIFPGTRHFNETF